jgi:hypothetical protein
MYRYMYGCEPATWMCEFYIAWSSSDARNCVICRVSQRIIFWKADEVVEELKVWGGGRRSG